MYAHSNMYACVKFVNFFALHKYARNIPKPNVTRRSTEGLSTDRGGKPPTGPTSDHSVPRSTPRPGSGHVPRRQHDRPATPGHHSSRTAKPSTPHANGVSGSTRPSRSTTRPSTLHPGTTGLGRSEPSSMGGRSFMGKTHHCWLGNFC